MTRPCELILALDVPDRARARAILEQVRPEGIWIKIGLQLFLRHGPDFVHEVLQGGFKVFLDLKLHDIPNTVASAVRSLEGLRVGMLTVHAGGGAEMMLEAAAAARESLPETCLLGVTVLTSMTAQSLVQCGINDSPARQVVRLARLALECGMGGVVCSPEELSLLAGELPADFIRVTPGIRPGNYAPGDQKRVMTPREARTLGSHFIVVGRPVLNAADPGAVLKSILSELA